MLSRYLALATVCLWVVIHSSLSGMAKEADLSERIQADKFWFEEKDNLFRAAGNVVFYDDNYELKAKTLSYDTARELLQAEGAVSLTIKDFNAKGEKAVLRTEDLLFEKKHNKLQAKKITLTVADDVISGDLLEYDKAASRLSVKGNVIVSRKEKSPISGQTLTYNTKLSEGRVTDYHYEIMRGGVRYFSSGKTLIYTDEKSDMGQAVVTTCDEPQPHYVFRTKKVDYFPEKKVVLHDSEYWQGAKKLFTTKKTVIAIHDGELVLPSAGYSDDEGWYLKTRQYYDLAGKDYGVIYTDYMAFRGLGVGFREFRYGKNGRLTDEYSLYVSRKPTVANQIVQGEWKINTDETNQIFSFRNEENGWRQTSDLLAANWMLLGTSSTSKTTAEGNFYRQLGMTNFMSGRLGQIINNRKDFKTYWDYSYSRNMAATGYRYTERNFNTKLEWTEPEYVTSISTAESLRGYDYTPKLTYYTTLPTPWQYAVSTARVTNPGKDVTLQQTDLKTYFRSKTKKIGSGMFLSTTSNVDYTSFGSSGATNAQITTAILKNINEKMYVNTSATLGQSRGWNPLTKSPTDSSTRKIDVETDYILDDYHRVNLTIGYDFAFSRYRPVLLDLEGRAFPFWSWNLYSEYELNDKRWQTAGIMLTFNPLSKITGYIRAEYNLPDKALREASIRLEGYFDAKWSYSVKTDYEAGVQLNLSEIKFIKDNHCQDLIISYYPRRRMIFTEIRLKSPDHKDGAKHYGQ